jgi:hypothetical protein
LVAALVTAGCTSSPSETEIRGTVVDASTGEPLRGVLVSARGTETETDRDGRYVLRGVPEGSEVTATICSHEEAMVGRVRTIEDPILQLGELQLQPRTIVVRVSSNLTGKGVKARFRGPLRGTTKKNGTGRVRGACAGSTLRFEAHGYEETKIEVGESLDDLEVVLQADPATTAEYLGELESRGRLSEEWDLIHPDVKSYATEQDYRATVNKDARAGYQLISIDAKSFRIVRWTFPACEYSNFGPKTYPRTAAVEAIYHYATPRGGGTTERTVTHWVQTKDGLWRWFANVGCSFPAP